MHKQLFRRSKLRYLILALLMVVTLSAPILSGTGLSAVRTPLDTAHAANSYENLDLDLAMSTAFQDAQNALDKGEFDEAGEATYWTNIEQLTAGTHFGNAGLLLGQKGGSKNSDTLSSIYSKLAMDSSKIKQYDSHTNGNNSFSKYQAFGTAVQNVNQKALKTRGASSSLDGALNQIAAGAGKVTGMGTTIIKDYNPAPILMSMVDANVFNTHPDNKLVAMVNNNPNIKAVFTTLGSPTSFGIPLYFLIMAILAFLLFVFSAFLMLVNGNSAGQGMRKAVIRMMIGCISIPLLAKGLDAGINFLDTAAIAVVESPEENYVEQNLNMLDWARCGFVIPEGRDITIDEKGRFLFSPGDVRAINEKVASLTGESTDAASMKKTMERYYRTQKSMDESTGLSQNVSLTKPNRTSDGEPWKTKNFYTAVNNLVEAKPLNEGMEGEPSEALGNVGYLDYNGLTMNPSGDGYTVTGQHGSFGVSPIAATNILRTTFDGSGMQVTGGTGVGSVAMDVDNYTTPSDAKMNGLVRMIAMFSMMIAAIKGMFTIFGAGFGGIFSGGAKAALGSPSGVGQAVGGIVAIVGGLFGIGLIMTATYGLLDQFYVLINGLIDGAGMDDSLLDPIRDVVCANKVTDILFGGLIDTLGSMICTVLCIIILPKFGGIPVTLFCQHLADLPNAFASRAQLIENRITGDYHSGIGGGGRGGAGSAGGMFSQAATQGVGQTKMAASGAKMAAAAIGGAALTKLGQHMEKKGNESLAGETDGDNDDDTKPEDGLGTDTGTDPDATANAEAGETNDNDQHSSENEGDMNNSTNVDGPKTTDINNAGVNTLAEKETDAENSSDSNVESLSDSTEDHLSDSDGADTTNTSEDQSMAEQNSDERMQSDNNNLERNQSEASSLAEHESDNTNTADSSVASENTSDSMKEVDQNGFASSHSEKQVGANGEKSMAGAAGAKAAAAAATTSQQATRGTNAQRAARQAGTVGNGTGSTMSKARPAGAENTPQREMTKAQKKANNTRAFGRALQAAGGHTTGRQALAGAAAGIAHYQASKYGAGGVTQSAVNAVQNNKDRARDRREGFAPGTSANQRANRRPVTTGNQNQTPETTGAPVTNQQAVRNYEAFLAEEAERQSE